MLSPNTLAMMQNCYNTKKLPQKLLDFQQERLTTKHIETLSFLKEIGKENQELKKKVSALEHELSKCERLHLIAEGGSERIKEIQEQYLKKADEVTRRLVEKHTQEEMIPASRPAPQTAPYEERTQRLLKKEEDRIIAEKETHEDRKRLQEEIEKLKKVNRDLLEKLHHLQSGQDVISDLEKTVGDLQGKLDDVTASRDNLEKIKDNQVAEIQRLRAVEGSNADLIAEVREVNQRNKELQFRLSRAQRELAESSQQEQEELLESLRAKLGKLLKQKEEWTKTEGEHLRRIRDLEEENIKLRKALNDSEHMRSEVLGQMKEVSHEVLALRRHSANMDKNSFRDFVSLKREVGSLKEENEQLKIQLKILLSPSDEKRLELPPFTKDAQKSRRSSKLKLLKD